MITSEKRRELKRWSRRRWSAHKQWLRRRGMYRTDDLRAETRRVYQQHMIEEVKAMPLRGVRAKLESPVAPVKRGFFARLFRRTGR